MPEQSEYFNQAAASLAAQVAAQAAQLEFQRVRFQQLEMPQFQHMSAMDREKLAFQKATEVWNQAFQEASVTGSYGGVPAAQYLLSSAQLTGQFYQPGQLNADQQAQYQSLQQQISSAQQQLMTLAPGSPEYNAASTQLAAYRAQLAPLQQVLQGTDKAPVQTLAAQNQQFQQQLALAELTGIVPTGTGALPSPGAGPTGAPVHIDEGLPAPASLDPSRYDWWHTLSAAERQAYIDNPPAAPGTPGATPGGTPTMAYLQMLAALTGEFNGEPTQAAMEFAKQFGLSEAAVTGLYNGQQTQAAKEFAAQLALQQQQMENSQANQLLQLAASLRGPRNAFQFAKVLGGTPQGLQDVLAAVTGRYTLPGYQGGGAAPEAVTLQNFMGDVQAAGGAKPVTDWANMPLWTTNAGALPTYAPQTGQWSTPAPAHTVSPPGAQAPTNAFNYQPTGDGSQTVYPPGISAPVQAGQVSSPSPLSGSQLQQIGASQLASQPYMLPRPSQWNAEAYNDLGAYRQDLLGAQYEAAGWDPQAAIDLFKKSLPQYAGPQTGRIAGIV